MMNYLIRTYRHALTLLLTILLTYTVHSQNDQSKLQEWLEEPKKAANFLIDWIVVEHICQTGEYNPYIENLLYQTNNDAASIMETSQDIIATGGNLEASAKSLDQLFPGIPGFFTNTLTNINIDFGAVATTAKAFQNYTGVSVYIIPEIENSYGMHDILLLNSISKKRIKEKDFNSPYILIKPKLTGAFNHVNYRFDVTITTEGINANKYDVEANQVSKHLSLTSERDNMGKMLKDALLKSMKHWSNEMGTTYRPPLSLRYRNVDYRDGDVIRIAQANNGNGFILTAVDQEGAYPEKEVNWEVNPFDEVAQNSDWSSNELKMYPTTEGWWLVKASSGSHNCEVKIEVKAIDLNPANLLARYTQAIEDYQYLANFSDLPKVTAELPEFNIRLDKIKTNLTLVGNKLNNKEWSEANGSLNSTLGLITNLNADLSALYSLATLLGDAVLDLESLVKEYLTQLKTAYQAINLKIPEALKKNENDSKNAIQEIEKDQNFVFGNEESASKGGITFYPRGEDQLFKNTQLIEDNEQSEFKKQTLYANYMKSTMNYQLLLWHQYMTDNVVNISNDFLSEEGFKTFLNSLRIDIESKGENFINKLKAGSFDPDSKNEIKEIVLNRFNSALAQNTKDY